MKGQISLLLLCAALSAAKDLRNLCAVQNKEILLPDELCNQFIQCHNGVALTRHCRDGLFYNTHLKHCDWAHNVLCGSRQLPISLPIVVETINPINAENVIELNEIGCPLDESIEKLIPHKNCNQFYQCWSGSLVAHSCAANLFYNPDTWQCDYPEQVDCGERIIPGVNIEESNNEAETEADNVIKEESSEVSVIDTTPVVFCAIKGYEGQIFPHENCNEFYLCAEGITETFTCPSNLLYDPETKQCDWPYNVECGDRIIPVSEDIAQDSEEKEEVNDEVNVPESNRPEQEVISTGAPIVISTTEQATVESDHDNELEGVPVSCDESAHLVLHENCNQFYVCAHGIPVALTCPGNLLYSPETEACEWPSSVVCGDRIIPEYSENDGAQEEQTPQEPEASVDPEEQHTDLEDDSDCRYDGQIIPNENCNQFSLCAFGVPVSMSCPGALLYNPVSKECDWPSNVVCGDRIVPEGSESPNVEDTVPEVIDIAVIDLDIDEESAPEVLSTSAPIIISTTEHTIVENEDIENSIEDSSLSCDNGAHLVVHENCNQFYVCAHGIPVALACPGNLLYSPETEACEWPSTVECGDRIIPDYSENDDAQEVQTPEEPEASVDLEEQQPDIEDDSQCWYDGQIIPNDYCNKFSLCAHGIPIAMNCPGELLFNPENKVCDWPSNVVCEDRIIEENAPEAVEENAPEAVEENKPEVVEENPSELDEEIDSETHENAPEITENGISTAAPIIPETTEGGSLISTASPIITEAPEDNNVIVASPSTEAPGTTAAPSHVPSEGSSEDGDDQSPGDSDICRYNKGFDGHAYPHEHCNQFYLCAHGTATAMVCPSILLFNPETRRCDWPHKVECGDRPIPAVPTV